tara:strand:+ start:28170 stop:28475 length:306 start_codon:yes stop_codon:yes gene_type:complete
MTEGTSFSLSGGRGMGEIVRGPALVSAHGFGLRYDLDATTGIISNRDHDLFGQAIADHILVFTKPKGVIAASWALASPLWVSFFAKPVRSSPREPSLPGCL